MKESGILNSGIASIISRQGHGDLLLITDAGFAIPKGIEVIDIALSENQPRVIDLLIELKKHFSVEKIIIANETKKTNPSYFNEIISVFDDDTEVETIDHKELRKVSESVKAIIRTGDFTAYANVLLVSGAGDRWFYENQGI